MLTIMDRIKKIILIISAWMKFIKVSIQMWQDFCWKRIIPGLIPFSMEPNLHTCSVADDIFQPHIDQFFNPALYITVKMYPCSGGTDTGSPEL